MLVDGLSRAFQHAWLWLRTNPRFVMPTALSLALGVACAAVLFSTGYGTLYPKLPYSDPGRVVSLRMHHMSDDSFAPPTTADYTDWLAQQDVFSSMGMFLPIPQLMTITGGEYPERIFYQYVTASLFPMLGARPQLGVTFAEKRRPNLRAVILSDSFWRRRFNADPGVIGKNIQLGGFQYEVIGVMPPGFHVSNADTDVWRETDPTGVLNERRIRWLIAAARLKPGITIAQAQAHMTAIVAKLAGQYPETNAGFEVVVQPLGDYGTVGRAGLLTPYIAMVAFVLVLACVNVIALFLAHLAGRRTELATRAALGASRGHLVRQLLIESLALAVVSALLSVILGRWWFALTIAHVAPRWDFIRRTSFDLPVVLFVFGVCLLVGLITGLIAAGRASRPDVRATLQPGAGVTSARGPRVLGVLAVAQIALAFALLVGAGLLARTLLNLQAVRLGFDTQNILTAEIDLAGNKYRGRVFQREIAMVPILPATPAFQQRLIDTLRRLPNVEAAGLASWVPMVPGGSGRRDRSFTIGGRPDPGPGARPRAMFNTITPGFLSALNIQTVRGRAINDQDTVDAPWVAMVNEAFAREFFPNDDPLGKVLTLDIIAEEHPRTIVGVVGDLRYFFQENRPARPEIYVHLFQQPDLYPGEGAENRFRSGIVIRTQGPSPTLAAELRRVVSELDPTQPVLQIHTMEEVRAVHDAPPRFVATVTAWCAMAGVLIAALGVFALISTAAAERAQEFGIRLALGATSGMLLRTLLIWSASVTVAGIAAGIFIAAWQTQFIRSWLYGVPPQDVGTFAAAAMVIMLAALLAALQSARRVRRLDTLAALRARG